jgi:uncharacterized protein (DUF736 family)
MPSIGYVTKIGEVYRGKLLTLSIKAEIEISPNTAKAHDDQPDYRVRTKAGYELGAAWRRTGETSGKEYLSLSLAAPEFGRVYANLGRAAGSENPDDYAIIWNAP